MLGNLQDNFVKQKFDNVNINELDELEQYILRNLYSRESINENLKTIISINFIRIT